MAFIDHRPDRPKPWRARYRGPDGRERCKTFARKVDAQRWLTEQEHARDRGTWTDPALGRVRFQEWLVEWWAGVNLRPTTRARHDAVLRVHVLPRFGAMPLAAIQQRDVRAWVVDLGRRGLAPATVHKTYQVLAVVMSAAVDAGMLPHTPCRRIRLPEIIREEMRFLTPVEVAKLAATIRPEYRALVFLGAYGGLRIGELAGLRRGRVDLHRGTVEVVEIVTEPHGHLHLGPPKTRASRRAVGLPRFVVEELDAHLHRPETAGDFLFAGPRNGPFRPSNFRERAWRPAVELAGLAVLRVHDLRHTAVALWIAAGATPKEVAARAGHTSVSFTLDRYGHLYPEADQALRDRLDQLYRSSSGGVGQDARHLHVKRALP
jgi:integrase